MHQPPTKHEGQNDHQHPDSGDEPLELNDVAGLTRRAFVKRSGFLLVGSVSCGEGTPSTAMGTFRLQLTGLHGSATTGGTATATPTAGGTPVQITIPATGDQQAGVPVGTYTVVYSPPPNHIVSASTPVPSSVTITEGQTTTVALTLIAHGNLQVSVTGLSGGSGGSASAQRTDAAGSPISITVSAAGTGTATNVPVGTYSVTYTPPSGFIVSGTNPVTNITVGLGTTGSAVYAVTATPSVGTVHVVVTGLGSAASGGSLSARLTNNTGATFTANLPAPTSGSSAGDLTSMPAGSYNVTYTPPGGFKLAAGQSNPQVVSVTAGNTTNANFTAEPLPPPAVLFHSDWSTATGKTDAAFRDTTKAVPWTALGNSNTQSGIETAASLGLTNWPTPNAFVIRAENSALDTCQILLDLGLPTNGTVRFYRFYFQMLYNDTHGAPTSGHIEHGIESAPAMLGGGNGMQFYRVPRTNGTWYPGYADRATGQRYIANGLNLLKNKTFRLEWRLAFGATTYTVQVRIYDETGTQIASEADFHRLLPSPESFTTFLGGETFAYTAGDHRWYRIGTNGPTSNYPLAAIVHNELVYAHGAQAVSSADWCGPYAGGI